MYAAPLAVLASLALLIQDPVLEEKKTEAETYTLAYRFQPGQVVHYAVSQSTTRQSRQGPNVQLVTDKVREDKHLVVTDVRDDGSFVLKTVFDRVRMEADFGPKKVNFDSAKPAKEDPPGFSRFRKSIAKPRFEVHFEPSGKLRAVRRLAAAGTADSKSAGRNTDGSSFLVVFPDKPLKVGDTWREEYKVRMPIGQGVKQNVEILRTYRLNSVKDGIAKLSFASSIQTPIKNPEILAKLIQSTPSGTVEFDVKAGQLVKRTMKVDKTVLNHSGPQSVLHTVSSRSERRVEPGDPKTASRN